jgi:carbon monoxide dehydrogenase subunit G
MNIKGTPQKINRKSEDIFKFLSNFKNLESIMPEEVKNWQAETDSCSFEIGGMVNIELRMTEKRPPSYLKINSEGKTPFPFTLHTRLTRLTENTTETSFEIDADVNPMLSLMVKRPLENLVNMMNEKLKDICA